MPSTVAAAERALKAAASSVAALAARQVEVVQEAEREQVLLPRLGGGSARPSAMEVEGEEGDAETDIGAGTCSVTESEGAQSWTGGSQPRSVGTGPESVSCSAQERGSGT